MPYRDIRVTEASSDNRVSSLSYHTGILTIPMVLQALSLGQAIVGTRLLSVLAFLCLPIIAAAGKLSIFLLVERLSGGAAFDRCESCWCDLYSVRLKAIIIYTSFPVLADARLLL